MRRVYVYVGLGVGVGVGVHVQSAATQKEAIAGNLIEKINLHGTTVFFFVFLCLFLL